MKLQDLLKESWDVKDGKVLSNGHIVGYYEFDRDSDSFWVDDVKKGRGQLAFDTKQAVSDYFKKNEKDALKHLQKQRGRHESISEATMHNMTREKSLDNLKDVIHNIKPYSREAVKHIEAAIKLIEKFDVR
jgi:histidyl-tRNA synthetase